MDEPTIGLLLFKDADKFVAETTLKNSLMKLGISKYKYIEELPEYLERKLNRVEGRNSSSPLSLHRTYGSRIRRYIYIIHKLL